MTLIEDIKKLRELEQAGTKNVLSWKMLDHAPVMLEVLGCFQEGDEKLMRGVLRYYMELHDPDLSGSVSSEMAAFLYQNGDKMADCLRRLQKAASLMEQEEREG